MTARELGKTIVRLLLPAAVIFAVIAALMAVQAEAYLNVGNAETQCRSETQGDVTYYVPAPVAYQGKTDAVRYSARDVIVRIRWFTQAPPDVARFYECRYVGDSAAWGGVTNVSFRYVNVAGPYYSNVSRGCWQPCYYFNQAWPQG